MALPNRFEDQWIYALPLVALPLESRAAWGILAFAGKPVRLGDFCLQMQVSREVATRVLCALVAANLARMEGFPYRQPDDVTFEALPAMEPDDWAPPATAPPPAPAPAPPEPEIPGERQSPPKPYLH